MVIIERNIDRARSLLHLVVFGGIHLIAGCRRGVFTIFGRQCDQSARDRLDRMDLQTGALGKFVQLLFRFHLLVKRCETEQDVPVDLALPGQVAFHLRVVFVLALASDKAALAGLDGFPQFKPLPQHIAPVRVRLRL